MWSRFLRTRSLQMTPVDAFAQKRQLEISRLLPQEPDSTPPSTNDFSLLGPASGRPAEDASRIIVQVRMCPVVPYLRLHSRDQLMEESHLRIFRRPNEHDAVENPILFFTGCLRKQRAGVAGREVAIVGSLT